MPPALSGILGCNYHVVLHLYSASKFCPDEPQWVSVLQTYNPFTL